MTEPATKWAIEPAPRPSVAVSDGTLFPVRRIWCVGRNYSEHAREMGGDPDREPPFFFAKPSDAVVPDGTTLAFPTSTADLHHEVELAVAIGTGGSQLSASQAHGAIFGYAVSLDMTRRDLQAQAKKNARPWEMGKSFDRSCPIGTIQRVGDVGDLKSGAIRLTVNGELRQSGDISDMIWSPAECVAALSEFVELEPGDIILTGTPAGVGAVQRGDRLVASIDGVGALTVSYSNAS